MLRSFDFCLPTRSTTVPDGEDWLHEVKYDGYRLRLERDGDRVRLITSCAPPPFTELRNIRYARSKRIGAAAA
jgi:hypothetical protein